MNRTKPFGGAADADLLGRAAGWLDPHAPGLEQGLDPLEGAPCRRRRRRQEGGLRNDGGRRLGRPGAGELGLDPRLLLGQPPLLRLDPLAFRLDAGALGFHALPLGLDAGALFGRLARLLGGELGLLGAPLDLLLEPGDPLRGRASRPLERGELRHEFAVDECSGLGGEGRHQRLRRRGRWQGRSGERAERGRQGRGGRRLLDERRAGQREEEAHAVVAQEQVAA